MSWLFSQALLEAYSPGTSSDGAQFAPLNVMPTRRRFWRNDKMMGFSPRFPSGRTSRLLTATHGRAVLTSFLAAFPVRTSARPERATASPVSAPASGGKWRALFAKFDRVSCSWKIPHCLPLVGSMSFLATWPRWGSMRNGVCMVQQMPERHIKGTGCGLWPSPKSRDGQPEGFSAGMRRDSPNLSTVVRAPELWPTPTVHGDYNRKGLSKNSGDGLATAVKLYPTPTSSNTKAVHLRGADKGKTREPRTYFPTPTAVTESGGAAMCKWGGSGSREKLKAIMTTQEINGALNPDWVEWLMGWPIGWTSLGPLNLETFHEWQREFRIESDGSSVSEMDKFRRAL